MSRDIYASMSGAAAAWSQLEVVANNLANASTAGFREQRVAFSLDGPSADPMGQAYVSADVSAYRMEDGPVQRDAVDTHLALQGRGFFVAGPPGAERLVRAGAFSLDAEGCLVTSQGDRVQGESGDIRIPEGERFVVSEDGRITDGSGHEVDRLRLVDADGLQPMGGSAWRATTPLRAAEGVQVIQGALEGSNSDPIRGMTALMEASRYFEAYQRAMQTSDQMDATLNSIAGT